MKNNPFINSEDLVCGCEVLKETDKNVVYKFIYHSQGDKVVGFLSEPKTTLEKLPCWIFNRGGYREFGAITEEFYGNKGKITWPAEFGYLVIASQYPGGPECGGIDEWGGHNDVQSIIDLYAILALHPKADLGRIGMQGDSRGAMMTCLVLRQVQWVKAAVLVSGSYDLTTGKSFRPEMESHYVTAFGGADAERIKRSPLYWANELPKNIPILLLHGSNDDRASPSGAINFSNKLLDEKITFRFVLFEKADHYLNPVKKEANELIKSWFDKYIKNLD